MILSVRKSKFKSYSRGEGAGGHSFYAVIRPHPTIYPCTTKLHPIDFACVPDSGLHREQRYRYFFFDEPPLTHQLPSQQSAPPPSRGIVKKFAEHYSLSSKFGLFFSLFFSRARMCRKAAVEGAFAGARFLDLRKYRYSTYDTLFSNLA